jgi:hypothetical protein
MPRERVYRAIACEAEGDIHTDIQKRREQIDLTDFNGSVDSKLLLRYIMHNVLIVIILKIIIRMDKI